MTKDILPIVAHVRDFGEALLHACQADGTINRTDASVMAKLAIAQADIIQAQHEALEEAKLATERGLRRMKEIREWRADVPQFSIQDDALADDIDHADCVVHDIDTALALARGEKE